MKKNTILAVLSILLIFCLVGCKIEKMQSFSYEAKDITAIEIETGAASVSVLKNSGDNIEVSYTHNVTSVEEGVLKINVPMPKAGINIKKQPDITVRVPEKIFNSIKIQSEDGNISVAELTTGYLTIKTEYGDITTIGLEGSIKAIADMGEIKTDLSISSEMKDLNSVGQELNGQIGTSESIINLYTNTGTIELK